MNWTIGEPYLLLFSIGTFILLSRLSLLRYFSLLFIYSLSLSLVLSRPLSLSRPLFSLFHPWCLFVVCILAHLLINPTNKTTVLSTASQAYYLYNIPTHTHTWICTNRHAIIENKYIVLCVGNYK